MEFKDKLKYVMERKDYTRKALAVDANTNVTTIGNYLRGERVPTYTILKGICEALEVSADYMMGIPSERRQPLASREVCGECKHHKYDKEDDAWICLNPDSDYCGLITEYGTWCYEWEERE